MTAITITRELGSLGTTIGTQIANQLGYEFVDENTIEGVFRQYGLTKFSDIYRSTPRLWDIANATNLLVVSMLNETFQALAKRGNVVILGRSGFATLSEYKDVLKVRIHAPMSVRVERVMARTGESDPGIAKALLETDDKMRRNFVQLFYNKRWDLETLYDLVLDTNSITPEMASQWTIEAARDLEGKAFNLEETTQNIEVDPVLLDAIDKVLENPLPPLLDD